MKRKLIKKILKSNIPVLLLGAPGVGKTFILEEASKEAGASSFFYILCHQRMTEENFLVKFNPSSGKREDGLLPTVAKLSHSRKIAVLVDEIDKTRTAIDNLFLDFLQNWRVQDASGNMIEDNKKNILIGFTSNDVRPISEPLLRRLQVFTLNRLPKSVEIKLIQARYDLDKQWASAAHLLLEVVRKATSGKKGDLNSLFLLLDSLSIASNKGEVKELVLSTLEDKFGVEALNPQLIQNLVGILNTIRKGKFT